MNLKKIILYIFLSFISIFWFSNIYWSWLNSSPDDILNDMKDNDIQETKFNYSFPKWITENLNNVKDNSAGYIQWLWFIWLSIALILIIYNGIYLIANFSNEDKFSKIKKRFISLIIWVVVLTSWYLVIKFAVSIIWDIF